MMVIKWVPLDVSRISAQALLRFRNQVSGITGEPSDLEIQALENQIRECNRDKSLYNLVAINEDRIVAWVNGKFNESRLTDMIRVIFFDSRSLSQQEVDNLFYQLEMSLPYPYRRIEIYGIGPSREKDLEMIIASGYRQAYDISHYMWTYGSRHKIENVTKIEIKHTPGLEEAYRIYTEAFIPTWDRDSINKTEFNMLLESATQQLSFIAYFKEIPAGIMIVNPGLDESEAYIQIVAVANTSRGSGVGDAMMAHLIEHAVFAGKTRMALSTYSDNSDMRKLLDRWNFVEQFRETVLYKDDFAK